MRRKTFMQQPNHFVNTVPSPRLRSLFFAGEHGCSLIKFSVRQTLVEHLFTFLIITDLV